MMNKQKWQRGFLMVDVLIAIVITILALVAMIGMFIQSTKATLNSAEYTIASNLAQQQMELLKNNNSFQSPNDVIKLNPQINLPQGFKVDTTAKLCPENSNDLIEVTVIVSWGVGKNYYSLPFTTFFQKKV